MDSSPDYLQRAINAERIASVIAHRRGHSFAKHQDEFGGDIHQFRNAIIDTLTDPATLVVKLDHDLYRFYNQADNVMVVIDRTAKDWGTAFRPDGNRGMKYMRESGIPINENGKVGYLNRLHDSYFTQLDRLYQQPEPLHLNTLTNRQSAELLLSIFDRIDQNPAQGMRLQQTFRVASLNIMPDMMAKIRLLPESEKAILRDCAEKYKMASRETHMVLKEAGLIGLKDKGGVMDVAAILRDPERSEAFIEGIEERYALADTPEEEAKYEKMLDGCENFAVLEQVRDNALRQTGSMIEKMRREEPAHQRSSNLPHRDMGSRASGSRDSGVGVDYGRAYAL